MLTRKAMLLASLSISVTLPGVAMAQDSDASASAESTSRTYEPSYFAQYGARNAYDMVSRIPGFSLSGVNQGRGFGQASQNVLINGQRVSGKSNDTVDALSRIAFADVIRVEVLDGATLGIPGLSGEVANVVYESNSISGNYSWNTSIRERLTPYLLNGSISITGGRPSSKWSFGLSNSGARNEELGPEFVYDANDQLLAVRDELARTDFDNPRLTGSYSHTTANGNIFNINGEIAVMDYRSSLLGEYTPAIGTPYIEDYYGDQDEWQSEIGADYSIGLGSGRLKLIGLQRNSWTDFGSQFDIIDSVTQRYNSDSKTSESILRSEYGWQAGGAEWELSLEGAYNKLSQEAVVASQFGTGPENVFEFPDANISERRAESILSYGRPLSDTVSMQLNIGGEYSRISVEGIDEDRQYWRPKGSIALNWRASPTLTADLKLSRIVDQLSFGDFLATVDLQNGIGRARNDAIVPPQRWRARLDIVKKLGAWGSMTPYVQFEKIEDPLEAIPISDTEEALGNLDSTVDSWLYGIDGTIFFAPVGLKGLRLDIHLHASESDLLDPLLGTYRALDGQENSHWQFRMRHDIPNSNWAWGGSIQTWNYAGFYRLDQYQQGFGTEPLADIFIENKDVFGLTLRASLANPLNRKNGWRRLVYQDRRDGPLDYREYREREYGRIINIALSGSF